MKLPRSLLSLAFLLSLSLPILACGGGGGGGGGGSAGRTTDTAVRLVHAAVALAPLEVFAVEQSLQTAAYAEVTDFAELSKGPQIIELRRANSGGAVFRSLSVDLAEETEYTIFLYGGAFLDSDNVVVLTEPVLRPEVGFARVQFLNGYESGARIDVSAPSLTSPLGAQFGGGSGFQTISSGPQEFVFTISGREFARVSVEVPDRGEVTLVASGSDQLGFSQVRVYHDLD